ncbi:acetate--CoA ligase family protein [Candidatus Micrarchaeota archaeon]|nr:acetate--CoA ligase family protein [Candidatus Micrarchaeota archaeon]MBI5176627.1 acetate--CoA ligase family protein [Candidatus Micrarchaeota archaeon]
MARRILSYLEAERLLSKSGFPLVKSVRSSDPGEVARKSGKLGFPLVVKAIAPNFTHKTEAGLVVTSVHGTYELAQTLAELGARAKKIRAGKVEFVVQKQLSGAEVIIGANRDASFGPTVLFGLGGIYAELLNEVSVRLAPLTVEDANGMIEETKAKRLLGKFRNFSLDEKETAKLIIKTGSLIAKNKSIQEIDFNPVFTDGLGCTIVDERIVVE